VPIRSGGAGHLLPVPSPLPVLGSQPLIRPSGVADLLIVRQQIKRYEAGEVANITNVLKGEKNSNRVLQTKTTELATTTEAEQTDEEQRDLQTTEHFDLKNEIDKTMKEDASLKAGVSVSGSSRSR
jgi:hypothetical protein